jgi:dTDP-glucose 4,6-dehydratase
MTVAMVTGGAGFMGHHLVEHILKNTDWQVILLDRLDTSGNLNRVAQIGGWEQYRTRCRWVWHDLKAPISSQLAQQIGPVDYVFHLAAGTHVDRSITHPAEFVYDNVCGTAHILDFCRWAEPERMIYFSTDEVFGPAPTGTNYREWDRYNSGNPYAATKAGAEELCLAYHNTFGLPVTIQHTMNLIGERQHVEKMVPNTIAKVRDGKTVTIHADKTRTTPGSRFYIHCRNVADASMFILKNGKAGDKYNVVGQREVNNLELAQMIADVQGKKLSYELVDFHSSRPGHDLRYGLDGGKLAAMGWKPPVAFEQSLERVVKWTLDHPEWLHG